MKPSIDQLRSSLNTLFTRARRLVETPEDLKALNERKRTASNQLLEKLIRGDDDGEWIWRA